MLTSLSQKFEGIFSRLKSRGKLSEKDVRDTAREVRRALLEADVNFRVAKQFVARIEERMVGEEVVKSFTPTQQVIKIVNEELTELLGGEAVPFHLQAPTAAVMVVGLQGSGKTTFCAKLANFLRKNGRKPILVALDVYRPAAVDQLEVLGRQIDIPVATGPAHEKDVVTLFENARALAREKMCDTLILDTAGRLQIDDEMMAELERLRSAADPEETLFVLDSMTGQEAVNVAAEFKNRIDFSGVVLTKLDGDARGGAALSVRSVTGAPIRFAGVGEKIGDLDVFHPGRLAGRILGMGDMLSLIEKTEEAIGAEEAGRLEKRIREQTFDLADFREQLKRVRSMGPLDDILKMIPGASRAMAKGLAVDEQQFDQIEAMINSMTLDERSNPQIIDGSRRKRIAAGSGTSVQAVNQMLKQFQQMKKMMKSMTKMQKRMKLPFSFN
ncbi:MAG: signal recognition particle protein [Candidatus Krumholzibacteriota bacterium]|nr:signal recognition particle protein [Candidatus Krumholzibacteriota bacterium]